MTTTPRTNPTSRRPRRGAARRADHVPGDAVPDGAVPDNTVPDDDADLAGDPAAGRVDAETETETVEVDLDEVETETAPPDDGPRHLPEIARRGDDAPMLSYSRIPPQLGEALRAIINRYELRHNKPLPSTIAVTSALRGEGVTTVSQAMSTLIAQETGKYVCWVDCSWLSAEEEPDVSDGRPGLIDILADRSNVLSAFRSSPDLPQLMSLRAGPVPEEQRNMIARSPQFDRLLDVLTEEFDHVVFDIPPILANANGLALVRRSDAALFVVRHRSTSISQVRRATEATYPTPNLGVVLNRYRTSIPVRLRRLLGE